MISMIIPTNFFEKYYLRSGTEYRGPLKSPTKNLDYFLDLIKVKLSFYCDNLLSVSKIFK